MSELNWQKDSQIEIDALDLEWVRHSHKYMLYSEAAARANDIVRQRKNDLEIVDAKLDQILRIEAEGTSKKLTADAIKASITANEEHIKALIAYNDALYQSDLCTSAVKAMDHKKAALQNLVQLWAGSYFAGPKQPRDLKKEIDIQQEGVQQEMDKVRARRRLQNN